MNKTTRNILIVVAIVLLIFGVILAIYSQFKSEPIDANIERDNILNDANTGLENLINDILEDNNENEEEANDSENTEKNNTTTNTQASNIHNEGQSSEETNANITENQTTPGEQRAIELVKSEWEKEWGSLEGVSFNNVMIRDDGKYEVSVNDSKTTKVIHRYIVDTNTGLVEERE